MDAAQVAWVGALGAIVVATISAIVTVLITRRPIAITAEAAVQTAINAGFDKLITAEGLRSTQLEGKLDKALTVLRALCQHLGEIETFVRSHGVTDLPARPPEVTEFMLDAGLAWPPADFAVIKGGKQ